MPFSRWFASKEALKLHLTNMSRRLSPLYRTFDGLKYDCQGEGEFHVLKSLDSDFEIQGRFIKFSQDRRPTVTKSLVWDMAEGDSRIQVTVPDNAINGKCQPFVHIDKELVTDPLESEFIAPDVQIKYMSSGSLEGFIFYHHLSGVQVTVLGKRSSVNGCVISAKFCLPDSWARSSERFVGLLGNADGDKWNDWMDRDNKPVTVPTSPADLKFEKSFYWCKNWCINATQDSLFAYEEGENFDKYNH